MLLGSLFGRRYTEGQNNMRQYETNKNLCFESYKATLIEYHPSLLTAERSL